MANQSEQYDIVLVNGRVIDPETYLDGSYNVGITGRPDCGHIRSTPQGQGGRRCLRA